MIAPAEAAPATAAAGCAPRRSADGVRAREAGASVGAGSPSSNVAVGAGAGAASALALAPGSGVAFAVAASPASALGERSFERKACSSSSAAAFSAEAA